MTIEIHELTVRITVTDEQSKPQPDWEAALQRLKQEVLERCREEIEAQQQRAAER